ncbi:hypothetical protein ACFL1X_01550, partial [Candidatus Hydrogenedentota bacterium]
AQSSQQNNALQQSESGSPSVRMSEMRKEAEENRGMLEKLREDIEQMEGLDDEVVDKLKQALDNAAKELSRLEQALTNEDVDKAEGANARALDELNEVELALKKARKDNEIETVKAAVGKVDQWIREEQRLLEETGYLNRKAPSEQASARTNLSRDQTEIGEEVRETAEGLLSRRREGDDLPVGLKGIAEGLGKAGKWMDQASQNLQKGNDTLAAKGQRATIQQLQKVREAMDKHLDKQQGADPESKLGEALEAVREMKESLQSKTGQQGEGGEGQGEDGQKGQGSQDGQGQPSESAKGEQSASSSTGRNNGEGKKKPKGDLGSSGPPSMPTSKTFPGNVDPALVLLENLEEMVRDYPEIYEVTQILAKNLRGLDDPLPNAAPAQIVKLDYVWEALDDLEELLVMEMGMIEHIQRLQQTPREELSPRFREMAARYYKALSSEGRNDE